MFPYDTTDDLASSLQAAGVDCIVIEDGFIKVPILEPDYIATVRVEGSWAVFKMFVGEWGDELHQATLRSLLLINQRLLGFRFAADRGEIWVQEEFPVELLNDGFHVYIHHVVDVLSAVIPSLSSFFESRTRQCRTTTSTPCSAALERQPLTSVRFPPKLATSCVVAGNDHCRHSRAG